MTTADVFAGRRDWAVDCDDSLRWAKTLPKKAVRCIVTSPPYFALRDYGTGAWEGGDPACDHAGPKRQPRAGRPPAGLTGGRSTVDAQDAGVAARGRSACKCGAVRVDAQLGLEASPTEYVDTQVLLFRRLREALTDDGTLWLNLGDSYNAYNGGAGPSSSEFEGRRDAARPKLQRGHGLLCKALKPKDLVGVPWWVAFALQADGWFLRAAMPWIKRNPMPDSAADRPTTSIEYVFLLAKSARYYYDAAAVRSPATGGSGGACVGKVDRGGPGARRMTDEENDKIRGDDRLFRSSDPFFASWQGLYTEGDDPLAFVVNTEPYKGAHFAVMPQRLVRPCVLAGSARGDVVLDPFTGSGTVLRVARTLGRRAVGCELNPAYHELIRSRVGSAHPGLI